MKQKREKIDRRVLYTRMFLRESLLELMREKPVGRITPTELCRRAGINRNTFYSHYDSPEALLGSIEEELFEQIRRSVERSLRYERLPALLTEICQSILENGDLCKTLFSDFGDKDFLARIINLVHDRCIAEWREAGIKEDEEQVELLFSYSVSGSVSVIQKWIQGGMKKSPGEIALFIQKASYFGLQAFIGHGPSSG